MAETTTPAATPAKKGKAAKVKKPKTAPTHPKVSDMVTAAISSLKERGGSSLSAIKKYIGAHYKVDLEKLAPFIKKYLKSAVASGSLVQVKGKGANGSFRISSAAGAKEKSAAKPKKPAASKKAVVKAKPKAVATPKKTAKPKKAAATKKATPKKTVAKKPKPAAAKKPKPAKSPKAKKPKAAKKASPKKGRK